MGVARLILALLVLLAAVPAAQANEGGSLSFPPQQLGAEPAVAEATLKNTTDYDLMLSPAPWFMGYDADAFDLRADNCAGRTLQSGESCTVEILFRPTHLGAFRSWLSYAVSAPGISHLYVTVNGETASPARITPGTLWMDPLPGEHNPLDFTVENVSDAPLGPLTCSTAPIPVDVSGCDGVTIPPGGSVTMTAYSPAAAWSGYSQFTQLSIDSPAGTAAGAQVILFPWSLPPGAEDQPTPTDGLGNELAVAVRKWRRAGRHRLLRNGFVVPAFKAPIDGRLELRVLGKRKLATGTVTVRRGKATRLQARLLPAGRRLLKANRKLRWRAVLRFVAVDGHAARASSTLALRPRK